MANELFDIALAAIRPHNDLIVARHVMAELCEASADYASLIQVENFPARDAAVHRAYERLRIAIAKGMRVIATEDKQMVTRTAERIKAIGESGR